MKNWSEERSILEHSLVVERMLASSLHTLIMKTGSDTQKALAYIVLCEARAVQMDGDLLPNTRYALKDLDELSGELPIELTTPQIVKE